MLLRSSADFDWLILAMAVYGVSWLLVNATGPANMFSRFRAWAGVAYTEQGQRYGKNVLADALNCIICTACWVAVGLTLLSFVNMVLLYPLCAIGVVILLSEVTPNHAD